MALTVGGKRVVIPGGRAPATPLSPLERLLVEGILIVNKEIVDAINADEFAEAIRDLDPDLFDRLLNEVLRWQDIQEVLESALRGVVMDGSLGAARELIRKTPRVQHNPMSALEYLGEVLPNGIIVPSAIGAPPDIQFSITTPVEQMFNYVDGSAVNYARTRAGQLVRAINESNRLAIRQLIVESFIEPRTVDQTAEMIRQIIGLHPRWARAVRNFHDTNYRRMLDDGLSVGQAQNRANELAARYRDKLIRRRAEMIARTEVQQAQNFGREMGWVASDRAGLIDPRTQKEWRTAPLGSRYGPPCPICTALRGTRVPWNGTFDNGMHMPPAHPNCRCTAVLVPPPRGLTGLPSQRSTESWIPELERLEAEQIEEFKARQAEEMTKHQRGKHDQKTHGAWAKGGSAREVEVSDNESAWQAVLTDEARALGDRVEAHPERYNPWGQRDYGLKDGQIETRVVRQDGAPRLRDYETSTSAGLTMTEASDVDGSLGMAVSGYGKPLVPVGSSRPPQHVYRVMSTGEFEAARERGYIQSDETMNLAPGEGTVTSLRSTGSFYAPVDGSDYRVVRIRYADEDGWQTDLTDGYIKTQDRVPFERVDLYTSPVDQSLRKHQRGKHDQASHGSWAKGRVDDIREAASNGAPTGITRDDLAAITADPAAYGFAASDFTRRQQRRNMLMEDDEAAVRGMIKSLEDGLRIREERKVAQQAVADSLSPEDQDMLVDYFETIRSQGTIFVAADPVAAAQIVNKGEFDSVFETNKSNGSVAYDARRREEFASHDLHPSLDPNLRPIYGYVAFNNPVAIGASQYGDVRFELKPEVKTRATMTDGDSLGSRATPVPMSGERITREQAVAGSMGWFGYADQGGRTPIDEQDTIETVDTSMGGYVEAQVKGGVKLDDVVRIHVDGPPSSSPASYSRSDPDYTFDIEQLEIAAAEKGIEIIFHGADL